MGPALAPTLSPCLAVLLVVFSLLLGGLLWRALARLAALRASVERLTRHQQEMYREVQHRVSNGIQSVASVLSLQASLAENAETEEALRSAAERLLGVAEVQRRLWDAALAGAALGAAIEAVARRLLESAGLGHVALTVEAGAAALGPERSTTLAMIVAEAVANSIKHAFADRRDGCLAVALRPAPGQRLLLTVSDDGPGPPALAEDEGETILAGASLGMLIMRGLAERLYGTLRLEQGPAGGALLRVEFPAQDAP